MTTPFPFWYERGRLASALERVLAAPVPQSVQIPIQTRAQPRVAGEPQPPSSPIQTPALAAMDPAQIAMLSHEVEAEEQKDLIHLTFPAAHEPDLAKEPDAAEEPFSSSEARKPPEEELAYPELEASHVHPYENSPFSLEELSIAGEEELSLAEEAPPMPRLSLLALQLRPDMNLMERLQVTMHWLEQQLHIEQAFVASPEGLSIFNHHAPEQWVALTAPLSELIARATFDHEQIFHGDIYLQIGPESWLQLIHVHSWIDLLVFGAITQTPISPEQTTLLREALHMLFAEEQNEQDHD